MGGIDQGSDFGDLLMLAACLVSHSFCAIVQHR